MVTAPWSRSPNDASPSCHAPACAVTGRSDQPPRRATPIQTTTSTARATHASARQPRAGTRLPVLRSRSGVGGLALDAAAARLVEPLLVQLEADRDPLAEAEAGRVPHLPAEPEQRAAAVDGGGRGVSEPVD